MPYIFKSLPLLLLTTLSLCAADPRAWTSTSGSTVKATYLGNFGDDLWFESATPQRSLLKMPSKYISSADLTLIETKQIAPQIEPKAIDGEDASLWLLEQLFKTPVAKPLDSSLTLEAALNSLLSTIPQHANEERRIHFHRKVDEDATRTESIQGPTVYACLQRLSEVHQLTWSIRKGTLTLRLR